MKKLVVDAIRHFSSDEELSKVISSIKEVNKSLAGMSLRNVECWLKREEIKQNFVRDVKLTMILSLRCGKN